MHMSTLFVISSALSAGAASGLAIDLALITKHLGIIVETGGPGFNILTVFGSHFGYSFWCFGYSIVLGSRMLRSFNPSFKFVMR